ncbi:MAG: hypothetical protein RR317_04360, partial [Bilophila sp.]
MNTITNDAYVAQMYGRDYTRSATEKTPDKASDKNTDKASSNSILKKALGSNGGYGQSSTTNALSSLVSETLSGLGLSAGDNVSFRTIMEYRDKLGKEFEAKVKADLKEL